MNADSNGGRRTDVICSSGLDAQTAVHCTSVQPAALLGYQEGHVDNNILCWHCAAHFEGCGMSLPVEYDAHRERYEVYGTFCSASCCAGWAVERRWHGLDGIMLNLNVLARLLGWPTPVLPALPACTLVHFGGPMSLEEFRGRGGQGVTCLPPSTRRPPLVAYKSEIEEVNAGTTAPPRPPPRRRRATPATAPTVTRGLYHDFYEKAVPDKREKRSSGRASQTTSSSSSSSSTAAEPPGGPLASFIRTPNTRSSRAAAAMEED